MGHSRRTVLQLAGASAATVLAGRAGHAIAADYPARPVRIIVPYGAGSAADVVCRVIAEGLSQKWHQTVSVDNRPGASGFLAMQELKRSKSGGYDFAFGDIGTLAVNPNVFASIPYDSLKDFLPVVDLFWSSSVVWVSNDSPYKTLRQLLDAGKASPGKLTYASTGSGSPTYMTAETLLYNAGKLDFLEIPFKEMGSLLTALATNEVDMLVAAVATAQPVMSRVRPLAVQSRTRLPQYPNIPTVEEAAGLPGFHYQSWGALITNAGVSPAIVNQVRADAIDVLKQADAKAKLAGFAVEDSRGMDSNALLALIQADIESTREPIKAAAERSRSRK